MDEVTVEERKNQNQEKVESKNLKSTMRLILGIQVIGMVQCIPKYTVREAKCTVLEGLQLKLNQNKHTDGTNRYTY